MKYINRIIELEKVNKNKFNYKNILHLLFLLLISIILVVSFYIKIYFPNETIEEFIFYINNGVGEADSNVFINAFNTCKIYLLLVYLILIILFYNILLKYKLNIFLYRFKYLFKKIFFTDLTGKVKSNIKIEIKKHKIGIYPFNFIINHRVIFTIIISLLLLIISFYNVNGFKFIRNNIVSSEFIEANYNEVNSDKVILNEKKNLIYIYLESFETTFFTRNQGGNWDYEVISEMYNLLYDEDATCFSCDNDSIGMNVVEGASFTTAAIVANSAGIPFKITSAEKSRMTKGFMMGAITIGDILEKKGYYNEVVSAARTSFGALKDLYREHGNYKIIDINSLSRYGYHAEEDDLGNWGINDNYMFEIAKDRLTKISSENTPFNFQIISIDTHYSDGFKGNYTLDKYDTQYENVYATESMLVYDFISWVKKQDFYKDTVIVIVGDHLSMQTEFFKDCDSSKRLVYSLILNSSVEYKNKNNRKYTALDMFPTTLAAMGATIYKDQMGLGINLYSNKETLTELYGIDYLSEKLALKSEFYNEKILQLE